MTAPKKGIERPILPRRDKVDDAVDRLPKEKGYNIRVKDSRGLGDHVQIPVDEHGIPLTEYLKADLETIPLPKKRKTK
jgi:hypothetical protein